MIFSGVQVDVLSKQQKNLHHTIVKQKHKIRLLQNKLLKSQAELGKSILAHKISAKKLTDYRNVKHQNANLTVLTVLPKAELFEWLLSLIKDDANQVKKIIFDRESSITNINET